MSNCTGPPERSERPFAFRLAKYGVIPQSLGRNGLSQALGLYPPPYPFTPGRAELCIHDASSDSELHDALHEADHAVSNQDLRVPHSPLETRINTPTKPMRLP